MMGKKAQHETLRMRMIRMWSNLAFAAISHVLLPIHSGACFITTNASELTLYLSLGRYRDKIVALYSIVYTRHRRHISWAEDEKVANGARLNRRIAQRRRHRTALHSDGLMKLIEKQKTSTHLRRWPRRTDTWYETRDVSGRVDGNGRWVRHRCIRHYQN